MLTKLHNLSFLQVLNLFLALLLNAFDNGDDDEENENENENDRDSEGEDSFFKRVLKKLTQTKTISVFPVHEYPLADSTCNSSQEMQTIWRKQNMGKEYSNVGKRVLYWANPFCCCWGTVVVAKRARGTFHSKLKNSGLNFPEINNWFML